VGLGVLQHAQAESIIWRVAVSQILDAREPQRSVTPPSAEQSPPINAGASIDDNLTLVWLKIQYDCPSGRPAGGIVSGAKETTSQTLVIGIILAALAWGVDAQASSPQKVARTSGVMTIGGTPHPYRSTIN
jgi:hypothetical protein